MPAHLATLDLVTQRPDGAVVMVLVEQGPWVAEDVEASLRRVQDRLYDCVEIACDGHLARRFPESVGKPAVIRLDCYETPDEVVRSLLHRFEAQLRESDEWRQALAAAPVASLAFEYNWRRLVEAG
jgi:hypothetical protein